MIGKTIDADAWKRRSWVLREQDDQDGSNSGQYAKQMHFGIVEERLSKGIVDGVGKWDTEKSIII